MTRERQLRWLIVGVALLTLHATVRAQEFSRHLRCAGTVRMAADNAPAHADFALRFANRKALVERSNILPIGERLDVVPSPAAYSMTFRLPKQGTQVIAIPGWLQNTVLVALPDLTLLNEIRLSIDRQSGDLEGSLLNEQGQTLGTIRMQCRILTEQELATPRL